MSIHSLLLVYCMMVTLTNQQIKVTLPSLKGIQAALPFSKESPETDKFRGALLKDVEYLITDLEKTIKDIEKLGLDKKLLEDYRKELRELYELKAKLQGKTKK